MGSQTNRESQTNGHNKKISIDDIDKLFRELKNTYLAAWTSNFKNEIDYRSAKSTWYRELRRFTQADLLGGLRLCAKDTKEFISLPKFLLSCRQYAKGKEPFFKPLPSPYCDPEVAEQGISNLRKILGRKR